MIPAINASNIYSTLGSSSSLVPLAIKDIANSIGLTAGSYITGDLLEGKDRFIDEFGTQALWLFGIPAYKKLIDISLYKALKIDPKFDVRNLSRKEILDKSFEYADKSVKESIRKASENPKFSKNLFYAKFGISTLLTIASYIGLTRYKQQQTKKAAEREILAEMSKKQADYSYNTLSSKAFNGFGQNKGKNVSFTGKFQQFMFDPVKNLMILDGAITSERLCDSRNRQERLGYTVKEGSFWIFMYLASKPIKNFLEKHFEKKHNKPIDLDSRVIECDELFNALKSGEMKSSFKKVLNINSDLKLLEFIHNNPDDFTVKMAKKSDIIKVLKNASQKDNTDYRSFIDFEDFKNLAKKLEKLQNLYSQQKETPEIFLNAVKKLKRKSVWINMGICVGALGVLAPAIMVLLRKLDKNDKGFQVKEDIKKQLSFNGKI